MEKILHFKKQAAILKIFDLFISFLVYFFIAYIYLYTLGNKIEFNSLIIHGVIYCVLVMFFRIIYKTYKQIWRYFEVSSYLKLIIADITSFFVFVVIDRLFIKPIVSITLADAMSLFLVNLLLSIIARIIYHYVFLLSKYDTKSGKIYRTILSFLIEKDDLCGDGKVFEKQINYENTSISEKRSKLVLMYITNDIKVASIAEKYGVDRIWIDLEYKGKAERQGGRDTVMSNHTIEDIELIAPKLTKADMLVRINPWDSDSKEEINNVIKAGAKYVMLPMWKTVIEVEQFIKSVDGRAKTVLLLETKEAQECLDDVLELEGIDEIHIGLNDLHISYGMTFMFELLANETVEKICKKISKKGIPYGFGGIAKIGDGALPAENVIIEHYRLGSTRAILSRAFCNTQKITDYVEIEKIFKENMKKLRDFENYAANVSDKEYKQNKKIVKNKVANIVRIIKEVKNNE